ncbi:MarR family winged helix-turn-helix transcriptional regulator [Niveispirillum sp. KHB5.9]|uniref:MarR family winged helix-turn-helix transcriptional regulator n=1 Tax=Niveispirillum sp. KHB5.9 TaxID=3400269 RepID=UPI003A845F10
MSRPDKTTRFTLRTDAAEAFTTDIAAQARLAARRLTRHLDRALEPLGMGAAQFGLLCLVASADDDHLSALALRAGLDPSTLTRNLEGLARRGWVEVTDQGADRRRRAAWLTETGARVLATAIPLWRQAQGDLPPELAGLTAGLMTGTERLAD